MKDNLSFRVSDEARRFVDDLAYQKHCSQGEAARMVLDAGIKAMEAGHDH